MLPVYNFNFDNFCNLLKKNFLFNGEKGIERDALLIYYLFIQKYSRFEFKLVFDKIRQIQEMSATEVDKILTNLSHES